MLTRTVLRINSLRRVSPLVVFIAALLGPPIALGQTNSTWNGGTGNWSNATDWTPNQVPNNGGGNMYNVMIDSGGTDKVILDQNATIASLTIGDNGSSGINSSLSEASGVPETLTVTGSVNVSHTGLLDLESGSTVTVSGNFANSGSVATNYYSYGGATNSLTVTGTFTNTVGASLLVGRGDVSDVVNIGMLVNNGSIDILPGATLNLTNQPNGITDVVAGSSLSVSGTFNAGSSSGLANLNSVEGYLDLVGQTTTVTPNSGTLTVSYPGNLQAEGGTNVTISGNLNNSGGKIEIDQSSLSVSGTLTNTGTVAMGYSTLNLIGPLVNNGTLSGDGNSTLPNEIVIDAPSVTFFGKGRVILADSTITGSVGGDVLVNYNTISGYGMIGDGSMGLVNNGIILASVKNNELIIDPSSAGFNNQGTLEVDSPGAPPSKGAILQITGPANSFLNFNANTGTLTAGSYLIDGGTLEFDGANIVTNDASITLSGKYAKIIDQNGNNGLANFAVNGNIFTVDSTLFADANVFTNNGTLAVGNAGKFDATTQLTNFNSATSTLTGGTYSLGGTGQLQFNNQGDTADIITNDATITLAGADTKLSIIDQNGVNALANFATNDMSGSLYITTERNFSTTGSLTNAGIVDVEKSSGSGKTQLTIGGGGSYTQTGGTTTVDGYLTMTGGGVINLQGGVLYGNKAH